MKNRNISTLLILVLLGYMMAIGQEQTKDKQDGKHLLKNPEVVRVELLPRKLELNENPQVLTEPYKVGSRIYFQIQITNTSFESVPIAILDQYFQNRPELLRGGEVIPYRKGLDKLLEAKDKDPFSGHNFVVKLEPKDQKFIGFIYVDDWYETLQPGYYQLSVKHRFEPGQDWIESSSITFEVVPKKPGK